ncbi:MAG: transporter [Acidimicrobiaceae bacterium]|nr:transporter [Acidimicrobiaceae bacterium]
MFVSSERRRAAPRLVFLIVSIALFMSAVDATIVATALPNLRQALHASIAWVSWSITAYSLGLAVAMPIAGTLGDLIGRRRVFIVSGMVFTASSLLCGLSVDVPMLVVFRFLQALGGGAFLPSASGIVLEQFGDGGTRAVGMLSGIFPLGALAGPVIGGILVTELSWRSVFLVNVPIGLAFTALAVRYLPGAVRRPGSVDLVAVGLLAAALICALLAVTDLADPNNEIWTPSVLAPLVMAAGGTYALVARSRARPGGLIPLPLFRSRPFLAMIVFNLVWGGIVLGFGALIPLYAEVRFGLRPLSAGTLLTFRAVGEGALAVVVASLLRRTGFRAPMIAGCLLLALGMGMMVVGIRRGEAYGWLAAAAAVTGLGVGASAPSSNNASLQVAPDAVGTIAGLRGMFSQFGGIFAVALTAALAERGGGVSQGLARSFIAIAIAIVLVAPLSLALPAHAKAPPVTPSSALEQPEVGGNP